MTKTQLKKLSKVSLQDRLQELTDLIYSIYPYSNNMPHRLRNAIGDVIELDNYESCGVNNIREPM